MKFIMNLLSLGPYTVIYIRIKGSFFVSVVVLLARLHAIA